MTSDSQLPGYNVDDDTHDDNDDVYHDTVTTEPVHADNPVLAASAGDAVASAATVSSPTPPISTQSRSTPPSQQERGEEHPTAATAAFTTPPPLSELVVDEFADPKISQLHAIFPDFDAAILYSVVDSVGGDQDRAVDALLAMSDPDHVPAQHAAAHEQPSLAEQTQLDEEFARRLLLEDEQQYTQDQNALRQQQQQQMRQFPYAQRTPIHHPQQAGRGDDAQQQSPSSPPPQRDTMTDVQEQISKIAETSKRTISSFVSKVKAKVQEFDQTRNTPNISTSSTSTGTGYDAQPPSPALDRHAQQAYYAPRVSPNPQPGGINNNFDNPPLAPLSFDRDSASTPLVPANSGGPPASNIDPGKIGLLPKRPVSLVNAESQPSHAHDEEEEELEYVENPFEEGKYS
ncbi:hypothetical protein DFH94DRAFT_370052 [Russula ochroleuca]|uniref:CUE domain-containing protein n=1 Tax=Russula ochroleuca TaxID=152965 RepID=A0A9P5MZC5_9AGAM|nr:hypothetical protein DFH94DRAFT_370052 [Russula ochroleuca]